MQVTLLQRRGSGRSPRCRARDGRQGRTADQLCQGDLLILDQPGYLPFPGPLSQGKSKTLAAVYSRHGLVEGA